MRLHLLRVLVLASAGLGLACDDDATNDSGSNATAGGKADDTNAPGETMKAADAFQERMLDCLYPLLQARTEAESNDSVIPVYSCLDNINDDVVHQHAALTDFAAEAKAFRDVHTYLLTKQGYIWDTIAIKQGYSTQPRRDYVWAIRSEVDFAAWVTQVLADDGEASEGFENLWWGSDGRTVPNSLQPCLEHLDDTFYPVTDADACIDDIAADWGDKLEVFVLGTGTEVDPRPSDLVVETETAITTLCEAATGDALSTCKVQLRVSLWSRVAEFLTMVDVLPDEYPHAE